MTPTLPATPFPAPRRLVALAMALLALEGCSTTTYMHLSPVEPPPDTGPIGEGTPSFQPVPDGKSRVHFDAFPGTATVVDVTDAGSQRLVCVRTPCTADVEPGTHVYRWLPFAQPGVDVGPGGVVRSKDGTYATSVDASADLAPGKAQTVRASFGQTEVHRSFPVGRGIGWALLGAGALVAVYGASKFASAPTGSADADIGQGWAEVGGGLASLGVSLWVANLRDSVVVTDRPGTFRFTLP